MSGFSSFPFDRLRRASEKPVPIRMTVAYWKVYRELTTDNRAAECRAGTAAGATSHRGLSP